MKAQVWFDGIMWVARRAGFPGRVFANSKEEALSRVGGWPWAHSQKIVETEPRKRKRSY